MEPVWVALATGGGFTLVGTVVTSLVAAHSNQKSIASLHEIVVDEKLPTTIRAAAAARMLRSIHRADRTIGWIFMGSGVLYAIVGALPRAAELSPAQEVTSGLLILVGLVTIVVGLILNGVERQEQLNELLARTRRALDPTPATDSPGQGRGASGSNQPALATEQPDQGDGTGAPDQSVSDGRWQSGSASRRAWRVRRPRG